MDCKEQTKALCRANFKQTDVIMLKLKIQRLEEEDFFVSISGKGLITHLKEKIVTFLKAAEAVNEDIISLATTSLRLIYKGMVLLDAKSLNFYKIQNDDTIQLCPLRRKKNATRPVLLPDLLSSGDEEPADAQEDAPGQGEAGRGTSQFTLISFSMGNNPTDLLSRSLNVRSRGRGVDAPENNDTQSLDSARRGRVRIQRRSNSSSRGRSSPATISGTLRSFKRSLEDTLRRVSSTSLDNRRDLIPQLNALITEANNLRDELQTGQQAPPMLPSPLFEILMLERMRAASRSNANGRAPVGQDEEKRDPSQAQVPPSLELIPYRNESIDIASDLLTSSLRYPALRVNVAAASEFPPVVGRQITPPQVLRGHQVTPENNINARPPNLPRNSNRQEQREPHAQRPTRTRNIFSSFLNRFSRR